MKHQPPISTIYCLRNPIDRDRIFYVGCTTQTLKQRLSGHIGRPVNQRVDIILRFIKAADKKPIIEPLEICVGYSNAYYAERFWIRKFNKRKIKLAQHYGAHKRKDELKKHFIW